MKILLTILFLLSLGLNCAYMTGCCSFHFPTSDTCGDHSQTVLASDKTEEILRNVAGKLKLSIPSAAEEDDIEKILLSEISKAERIDFGYMADTNVLKQIEKVAISYAAQDDFDNLCELIKKVDGKRILILEP